MLFILTGDIQIGKTRWLQRLIGKLEERDVTPYGVIAPGIWIEHATNEDRASGNTAPAGGDALGNAMLGKSEVPNNAMPGDTARSSSNTPTYEKLGINNELLPGHEVIPFARRIDLVDEASLAQTCKQSQGAQLAWAIDDAAIDAVNAHLDAVMSRTAAEPGGETPHASTHSCGVEIRASRTEGDGDARPLQAEGDGDARPLQAGLGSSTPFLQAGLGSNSPSLQTGSVYPGFLVIDEFGRLELLRNEGLTAGLALIDRGFTASLPHALIIVRAQLLDVALERFSKAPWGGITAIAPDADGETAIFSAFGIQQ